MLNILLFSLLKKIKTDIITTSLILIGLITSLLCVSVLLGYAQTQYKNSRGINNYSTITIEPNKNYEVTSLLNDLNDYRAQCEGEIINILYLTRLHNDTIVIGWDGTEISRWFPTVSSRFFSEEEVNEAKNVVYVTYQEKIYDKNSSSVKYKNYTTGDTIILNHEKFKVIGTGWIEPFNIYGSISNYSTQTIISSNDSNLAIRIIPYTTFYLKYSPDLILLQFADSSYNELIRYCNEIDHMNIGKSFPPAQNSDKKLADKKTEMFILSMLLVSICVITITQIMQQWLINEKKQILVYMLCGLPKIKVFILICAEWLIYILFSLFISLILNHYLLTILSHFGVEYLPNFWDMLLISIGLLIFIVIIMIRRINCALDITKKEDEL